MSKWKYLRMFVSSTFVDMDFERDILKNIVEPRLNEYLKDYGTSIEFIDLRHSVKTDTSHSLKDRENEIFNICLEEIDNCRPYFMGIIGHRYGWIPAQDGVKVPDMALPEEFPLEKEQLNVTMFEFMHGLFAESVTPQRCMVFLRGEASYDALSEVERGQFVDQSELVGLIREYFERRKGEYNVIDYSVNLGAGDDAARLELAEIVEAQVLDLIKGDLTVCDLSELEEFNLRQDDYVQRHIRNFKGREEEMGEIWELLDDPTGEVILTAQERGVGLTSLFCKVYDKLRADEKNICLLHCEGLAPGYTPEKAFSLWLLQLDGYLDNTFAARIKDLKEGSEELGEVWKEMASKLEKLGYRIFIFTEGHRFNDKFAGLSIGSIFTISTALYHVGISYLREWMYFVRPFSESAVKAVADDMRGDVIRELMSHPSSRYANWLSMALSILKNLTKLDFREIRSRKEEDNEERILNHQIEMARVFPEGYENIVTFLIERLKRAFRGELIDKYLFLLSLHPDGWSETMMAKILRCEILEITTIRQILGEKIIRKEADGQWKIADSDIKRLLTATYELKKFKTVVSDTYAEVVNLPENNPVYIAMMFKLAMLSDDYEFCVDFITKSTPEKVDSITKGIEAMAWYANFYRLDYMRFLSGILAAHKEAPHIFYNNFLFWIKGLREHSLEEEYVITLNALASRLRSGWAEKSIDLHTFSVAPKAIGYITEFYGERDDYEKWMESLTLGLGLTREYYKEDEEFLGSYLLFLRHKFLSLKNKSDLEDIEIFNWVDANIIKPELNNEFRFAPDSDVSGYAELLSVVVEFLSVSGYDDDADLLSLKVFNLYLGMLRLPPGRLSELKVDPEDVRVKLLVNLMTTQKLHFHNGLLRNAQLRNISEQIFKACEEAGKNIHDPIQYSLYHRTKAAYWFLSDIFDEEKFGRLMELADSLIKKRDNAIKFKNIFYLKESASMDVDATYDAWLYAMSLAMYILCDKRGGLMRYIDRDGLFPGEVEAANDGIYEFSYTLMLINMSLLSKKTFRGGLPSPKLWDSLLILWQAAIFHALNKPKVDMQTVVALYNSIGDVVHAMRENGALYPLSEFKRNLRGVMDYINSSPREEMDEVDMDARYY